MYSTIDNYRAFVRSEQAERLPSELIEIVHDKIFGDYDILSYLTI